LCFYLSLVDDTHILTLARVVPLVFQHFAFLVDLCGVGCLASQVFGLAPFSLPLGFAPLVGFCCCVDDIRILGVLVGFGSFSSSFLQNTLGLGFRVQHVHHVDVLLKL